MNFIDRLFLYDSRRLTNIILDTCPCVDVTITSPPYWNLKNYGGAPNQIGYKQKKDEYLTDIELVLKNCLLVTKPTGSLWLVVDDYSVNAVLQLLPWEIAERARKVGWILRDLIVWDKHHSVPYQTNGRMRNVSEFIFVMSKTDAYKYDLDRIKTLDEISKWWVDFPERFNPKGKTPTNIWSIPFRTKGAWRKLSKIDHHCSFPTTLVARIIELTTDPGDLVMDPFAGSSIVLAQAAAMGRHFVGFEINKDYVQMFNNIVKKEVAAEWAEIQKWRENDAIINGNFEKIILKLRALKYTRQVTKPFIEVSKKESKNKVRAILCLASIPRQYRRKKPTNIIIYIAVDQHSHKYERALRKALERAANPPLSQYEILPKIKVILFSSLRRKVALANSRFYLYPEYKPRQHAGVDSLKRWLEGNRLSEISSNNSSKIPMLANIAVDVGWIPEQ